jgi:glycosyltransferase involved in cell wall biosynthesis
LDASFLKSEASELQDTPRLVCVGRLCEQKGQLLLVQAAARLHAENVPFELILAGDGPLRGEIEALIGRNNLTGRVVITGWLTNQQVREQILAARALVLPSFAEGLPVVLMEALALRRPVISTYVAGIPELVEEGKCGYLVPAGCVDRLVEALRRILTEDIQHLRNMGREGALRVAQGHDVARESQKLALLFQGSSATMANGSAR